MIPVSKRMMTVSYVLTCCSFAFLLFAILYVLVDYKQMWNGAPFIYAGTYNNPFRKRWCISYIICHRYKPHFPIRGSYFDKRLVPMGMENSSSHACIRSLYELMDDSIVDDDCIRSLSERYYYNCVKHTRQYITLFTTAYISVRIKCFIIHTF